MVSVMRREPFIISTIAMIAIFTVSAPSAENRPLDTALSALLKAEKPTPESKEYAAVIDTSGGDPSRLAAAFRRDANYPPLKPGYHQHELTYTSNDKEYPVRFTLRIPRGYTVGKSWPLVIAIPGTHMKTKPFAQSVTGILGDEATDEYVILSPTTPGPDDDYFPTEYNSMPYQELAVLEAFWKTRHLVNVDDDRVYLTGYSLGGHATWHHAGVRPHLFAAAIAMAGVPHFRGFPYSIIHYVPNYRNLPFIAIWGELDRKDPARLGQPDFCRLATGEMQRRGCTLYRGIELKQKGHAGCYPEPGRMHEFFSAHRRTAAPESFSYDFFHPYHGSAYFITALQVIGKPLDWEHPPQIRLRRRPPADKMGTLRVYSEFFSRYLYRITGGVDRETNTLRASGIRITRLRIKIYAGMLDLDKPVIVKYLGKRWAGHIPASAACALKHYMRTRDISMPVVNELEVTRTTLPEIVYDE